MTADTPFSVRCVDPDSDRRAATVAGLEAVPDLSVAGVATVDALRTDLSAGAVDCVVTEHEPSGLSGFAAIEAVRELSPDTGCIIYTNTPVEAIDTDAFRGLVAEYLPRDLPDADTRLRDLVRNVAVNRTQVGYPVPEDERDRLAALRAYDQPSLATVDTFDRLTRLMAAHFDVTVAFVGLVDEREERFLACHGADWETLSREDTICTYAILEEEVTIVEDVQADPRFAENETLAALGIRAYAGANITGPDGSVLGSVCLTNDQPRSFSKTDELHLRLFAEEVSEQLELRRRLSERGRAEDPAEADP